MTILTTSGWQDYELLDSGNRRRLERFGPYVLSRPDPECLWQPHVATGVWQKANASFDESEKKGKWLPASNMPDRWEMRWRDIRMYAKLSPFKHTGIFPEQTLHWEWMEKIIKKQHTRKVNVLNLFGYTGIASLVCAAAGAEVTHVDGSYPTIGWARENQVLSGLEQKPIRWILDDCLKFAQRELRRGVSYDGIIMDPPVFGHGPNGERWEFSKNVPLLLQTCQQLLTREPLFVLINAYAVSSSALLLQNMLEDMTKAWVGSREVGELALEEKERKRLISTGIFARWSRI